MSARLLIEGEVTTPQALDFETLRSVSEQLVEPSALLAGREIGAVRLDPLLALAGVGGEARSTAFESTDESFLVSMSVEAARNCVVVYRVEDSPCRPASAAPSAW